jgi:hypothetical protein
MGAAIHQSIQSSIIPGNRARFRDLISLLSLTLFFYAHRLLLPLEAFFRRSMCVMGAAVLRASLPVHVQDMLCDSFVSLHVSAISTDQRESSSSTFYCSL